MSHNDNNNLKQVPQKNHNVRSLYDFSAYDINGNLVDFKQFIGKTCLIVNVASEWGFTDREYKQLQKIYEKYKDNGFVVLAFPCNQFGEQEPGSNQEIKKFVKEKYGVTFPMFAKIDVNGPNQHPVYAWLKHSSQNRYNGYVEDILWNFTKFLINKEGQVFSRYDSKVAPVTFMNDIKNLL